MRIGYAISNRNIIKNLYKFRPVYEVNGVGVHFALKVLDMDDMVENNCAEIDSGKNYLVRQLEAMGLHPLKSYTNFVNIPVGANNVQKYVDAMKKCGILIKAGESSHPLLRECIRITIGSKDIMREVVEVIRAVKND